MDIKEIYKVDYMKDKFGYIGTLRNEKRFNIGDNVFVSYNGNKIFRGRVIGVELPLGDNQDYIYKVHLPNDVVTVFSGGKEVGSHVFTLFCDTIFRSWEEAKASAVKNLELTYKLQKEEIERYFSQFKPTEPIQLNE